VYKLTAEHATHYYISLVGYKMNFMLISFPYRRSMATTVNANADCACKTDNSKAS